MRIRRETGLHLRSPSFAEGEDAHEGEHRCNALPSILLSLLRSTPYARELISRVPRQGLSTTRDSQHCHRRWQHWKHFAEDDALYLSSLAPLFAFVCVFAFGERRRRRTKVQAGLSAKGERCKAALLSPKAKTQAKAG